MFSKFRRKGNFLDKKETKRGPNLVYFGKKSPKGDLVFHPEYLKIILVLMVSRLFYTNFH